MKKVGLLLIIVLLIPGFLYAQETQDNYKWRIGSYSSVGPVKIYLSNWVSEKYALGLGVGFNFDRQRIKGSEPYTDYDFYWGCDLINIFRLTEIKGNELNLFLSMGYINRYEVLSYSESTQAEIEYYIINALIAPELSVEIPGISGLLITGRVGIRIYYKVESPDSYWPYYFDADLTQTGLSYLNVTYTF